MARIADMVVERYLSTAFRAAHPGFAQSLKEQLLRSDPRGYVANCYAIQAVDWLGELSVIRCPTLVIAGAQDVGAPPAMAEAIAQRVPGATLAIFDEASHLSVAEQPQQFADAVNRLLAKVSS